MYELSRDYDKLFDLICAGHIAVGFVDYPRRSEVYIPMRDFLKIQRRKPYDIYFGVRGIQYGGLYGYEQEEGKPELGLFKSECERMNLEWICGMKDSEVNG